MKRIILILFIVAIVSSFVCAEGIDENTVLMLHMDDAGLTDSSDSSHSVALNGDAVLNTGTYKFGSGSAYFDGEGDYLSLADSDDWNFGTGDFTIDFYIRPSTVSGVTTLLERWAGGFQQIGLYIVDGTFTANIASYSLSVAFLESGVVFVPNQWFHVAIVRNVDYFTLYVAGVNVASGTQAGALDTDLSLNIAGNRVPGYAFAGYMDEVRISKGIARWTSDFTPPTAPYSASALAPFTCGDTVSYEGKNYNTVLIGEQCWFAENLNVGTRIDGSITMINNSIIEKYCYFDTDSYCDTDGGLYQWNEVMQYAVSCNGIGESQPACTSPVQGICPNDWHIPSHYEYVALTREVCTSGTCVTDFPYDTTEGARGTIEGDKLKIAADCAGAVSCGSSGLNLIEAGNMEGGLFYNRPGYGWIWASTILSTPWTLNTNTAESRINRVDVASTKGKSVRCLYDGAPPTPTSSNFTSTETTNFSAVADITNVTNLTLAKTGKGKIKFPESTEINAEAQDYDTNIVIEDEFISVNTAALDETFNSSATITLEGVTCPVETITYQEGTFTSKDDIIAGGNNCELDGVCSNIQCIGTNLTFDVAHFTGFAAGADANLTIQAEAGVFYPLDPIEFTAEYINSTDGTPISGECNITFDDDWDTEYTMDFDTDYNYTKSFATAGLHEYNVTCSNASFVTLEANDSKLVSSVDIPEFSVLTLGLGLMVILIGLFIIRKKR